MSGSWMEKTRPARTSCNRLPTGIMAPISKKWYASCASRAPALSSPGCRASSRSEEHTFELQSQFHLVCRLLLEKKKKSKADIFISKVTITWLGVDYYHDKLSNDRLFDKKLRFSEEWRCRFYFFFCFFFNDTATTEIYTLSLHDALPIYDPAGVDGNRDRLSDRHSSRHR